MPSNWMRTAVIAALMLIYGSMALANPPASEPIAGQENTKLGAGSTFTDCSDCPEMVVVPAGRFLMGLPRGEMTHDIEGMWFFDRWLPRSFEASAMPQHSVRIDHPFGLGKYDVTRGEFAAFIRDTGYRVGEDCTLLRGRKFFHPAGASWLSPGFTQTDRDPVVCVTWQDARAYVSWLNNKLHTGNSLNRGGHYRLPTEAEWEYAARAGQQTARWWGDLIGLNNADCDECGSKWDDKGTAPVGSFRPNPFGLYDMLGNVWQWVEDCWHGDYGGAPSDDSAWVSESCTAHVMRGGGWPSDAWVLRSAIRSKPGVDKRTNYIGFRIAKALP